ncbi:MAG: hypothetical protein GEU92_07330 [Alphaproteobacteria bacterium]|nr:hypothetical protein [Alphaproteobacteria bacterium]
MHATRKIGQYSIGIDYDEELALYTGTVVNRPYRVRLTAPTREQLEARFERLLVRYIGVRPGEAETGSGRDRRHSAPQRLVSGSAPH